MSWCPLFPEITNSSVWQLPPFMLKAWLAILTHKDHETHEWRGNKHTLARICHFSIEEAEQALQTLSSPDPGSLTPDENGARIVSTDGEHWHVVTGAKYQERIKREIERQLARERMAKWRAGKRANAEKPDAGQPEVPTPRFIPPTEAEVLFQCQKIGLPEIEGRKFFSHFDEKQWKPKSGPVKDWRKRLNTWKLTWESNGRPMAPKPKSPAIAI